MSPQAATTEGAKLVGGAGLTLAVLGAIFVGAVTLDDTPRTVDCWAYADGGYTEWRTVVVHRSDTEDVWQARAATLEAAVSRAGGCREVGEPSAWDKMTGLDEEPTPLAPQCRCWQRDAGLCLRADGGTVGAATQYRPGTVTGAGCVPMPCGGLMRVREGDELDPMPEACR